ncbi:LysR family transcriptional regulator [Paraburkholderia terricola]|uniref:LysR family transcriptional regulator n=2 Tax=Burkholderiaceae TaxID=119060 RepID=UPI00286C855E|nr:LysR family transcriptional regulator [Paraburkholderia terricola]
MFHANVALNANLAIGETTAQFSSGAISFAEGSLMSVENLSGLSAFVRAVEAGSFTGAARLLGTTPSAVSRSVGRLERRLGIRLFRRSTRATVLTIEGRTYYERIAPLIRGIEEAGNALTTPLAAVGKLRISVPGALARILLDPLTRHLMAHHPGLLFDVNVSDHHVDVIREGFDLVIRAGEVIDSALHARKLGHLPLALVASPDYLNRHGVPESISDLGTHRHVRYRLAGRVVPVTFADGVSVQPEGAFDTHSGEAMRLATLNGLGIAQVLKAMVQEDVDAGRLCRVLPELALRPVPLHVLHGFGRNMPPRTKIFIDFAEKQFAQLMK